MSMLGGMGGMLLPPVIMQIIADSAGVKAGIGEATTEMGSLEAATSKFSSVGGMAMGALALGVAAVGAESVKLAMNFDQTMELVHTQALAPQSAVEALKGKVLDLAGAVGQSPDSLAEGLYHIASVLGPQVMSSAQGQAQAMDILTQSAKLASLGMANLDDVTYAMSGVMSVGMKDVSNATDGIALMNATVGMGDMRMQDLARAIGTGVLPAFKTAGLGMADFSAAMATLADNSVPADEAATRLRMTIALMTAPSGKAVDALKALGMSQLDASSALTDRDAELAKFGITVSQLAADMQQPNGLLVAVKDLKSHLEGLSAPAAAAVIEKAFGGGKTSGAIETLLTEADKLQGKYDALGTTESRAAGFQDAWGEQQKQFSQQWHDLTAQLEVFGVKIGNWLIPKIQDTIGWMEKHTGVVKILAVVIGGVLVAAMLAFTASLIAMGVAALANPVVWIVIAIIAAVALLSVGIYELVTHWSTVWGWIKRIADDVWKWLVDAWHTTIHGLEEAALWVKTKVIDPVIGFFRDWLWPPIKLILDLLVWWFKFSWGFLSVVIDDFRKVWGVVWDAISDAASWAWNNVIKPVMGFIDKYGIQPVLLAMHLLHVGWNLAWEGIKTAAQWAWDNVLKPVFGFINDVAITPIKTAINDLKDAWGVAWQAIQDAVSKVWDFVRPIFDAIGGGLDKVKSALGDIAKNPGKAGADLAHLMGFAEGGTVPGPPGAPMLAVVHGGEQVLSRDQLASMSRGGSSGSGGGGAYGDTVINLTVVASDGRVLRTEQLREARRKGQSASTMFPVTVGALP